MGFVVGILVLLTPGQPPHPKHLQPPYPKGRLVSFSHRLGEKHGPGARCPDPTSVPASPLSLPWYGYLACGEDPGCLPRQRCGLAIGHSSQHTRIPHPRPPPSTSREAWILACGCGHLVAGPA